MATCRGKGVSIHSTLWPDQDRVALSPPGDVSFSLDESKPFCLAPHRLGIWKWVGLPVPWVGPVGLLGPALGPQQKGTGFRGAGTQTQGVILLVILVQRPQDGLLGADGLQPPGSGY